VRTTSVVTNTAVTTAYRGAGRPEATAAAERAMDLFALELGMDPAEVRRINLIPKFLEPHTTAVGQTYDVGDYEGALDKALAAAGYADLRAEQARAAPRATQAAGHRRQHLRRDHRRRRPFGEHAKIEVLDDGRATSTPAPRRTARATSRRGACSPTSRPASPWTRSTSSGATPTSCPRATARWARARCSRAAPPCGTRPAELVDKARKLAAKLLEADEADVVLDKDRARSTCRARPPITKGWAELAVAAKGDPDLPEGLQHALFFQERGQRSRSARTWPWSRSTPRPAR
jgi:carbon-monoxide dehydrogenase large subunit